MNHLHLHPVSDTGCQHTMTSTCTCNPEASTLVPDAITLVTHKMVGDGEDQWIFTNEEVAQ